MAIAYGRVQIEANGEYFETVKSVIDEIRQYLDKNNFYRCKRIRAGSYEVSFQEIEQRDWSSVILDLETKKSIRQNSIGFLGNFDRIQEFGIMPKRGIILAGPPGTGKTIVCQALMSEAENITCIATEPYDLLSGEYFSNLYFLAQDLSPSIVFIEDIDFVGMERQSFYRGTPALLALLAEMDGIKKKTAIVTVGTSNSVDSLDKALLERPSRFDIIYRFEPHTFEQRIELINNLSEKVLLASEIKQYIAEQTNGFSPAQVQGVIEQMVISYIAGDEDFVPYTRNDVDKALSCVTHKESKAMGFCRPA